MGIDSSLPDSLSELLKLIAGGKLAGDALNQAKRKVRELWLKREIGFTPDPELAKDLIEIGDNDAYKRMKDCIGSNHPYLSLIRVGLKFFYISREGDQERIGEIKRHVSNVHGQKGVRILNMGATGTLEGIIRYLSDIKIREGLTQADTAEKFEEIVRKYMEVTIFHKGEDSSEDLKENILKHMNGFQEIFFVFASGFAASQATNVIADLNNNSEIRKRNYAFDLYRKQKDDTGRELFTWVFQLIGKDAHFV